MTTMQIRMNAETQGLLNAAQGVIKDVNKSELTHLGLLALSRYKPEFDALRPGWVSETLPDATPEKGYLHVSFASADDLLLTAKRTLVHVGAETMLPDSDVARLGLKALALFGQWLDTEHPDWRNVS